MPYIAIKAYPKDEKIKEEVAQRIQQVFLDLWGCAPEAITISMEEVAPTDWHKVEENEIAAKQDNMMILHGEKRF